MSDSKGMNLKNINVPAVTVDSNNSTFRRALPQLLAVSVKNILLLTYGMTLGFPTIVIPSLKGGPNAVPGELVLSIEQLSWISSINLITVPLGCVLSGVATQPMGRKKAMQVVTIPFIAAWILFHYAYRVELLYFALALTGFTGGLLEAPVITYVAEITQPHLRGMLSATGSMCVILGVFIQFLLGTFMNWRNVALVNLVFPIITILALFFVPESPHWLITKNRLEEAIKSLAWLRGWCPHEEVEAEFQELYKSLQKNRKISVQGISNAAFEDISTNEDVKKHKSNLSISITDNEKEPVRETLLTNIRSYLDRKFFYPYLLVCFAFFLGHFSGMTTLQTFAVDIFETLKAPIDKYYATLILGIVELFGTLMCVMLVHYVGKRPLIFVSTTGCGICFIIVATYSYLIGADYFLTKNVLNAENNGSTLISNNITTSSLIANGKQFENIAGLEWIPMTFLIGSAFLSHMGIRMLPWVLIGEVYHNKIRSTASGLSGGTGYIFGFAANKSYFSMIKSFTLAGTFWLYGTISLIGTIVFYFILPETEGKSLIEIEAHFAGIKRLDNSVGKKYQNNSTVKEDYLPEKQNDRKESIESKL